ncbi:cation diffusion facilitator family transporter [Hephaestia caeni]|jgi:cation diffusion facilitator family transporter|uniref:Cation diffusion facilitator family transporter n=2 Tax=Alphaproteobacteria TaxID=28211 RepID=A0A397NGY1_9SPHN|nr:CDF family Co(II)/Ni(II) efflux transporter DmeF [Hephaestia caeni]ABS68096.1 cation diffusion facilitator family transporter [Xanthobacter autotrophicus Py2]KOX56248.1 cation transporter [Streptomyces purpurogeneiscleroticus]ODT53605.1 MAG: cation transporter [Methylobacterium sp. SCN 67-24]RIA36776.1 cation diffusion facilitator family transporter [Hephaestia caeni]
MTTERDIGALNHDHMFLGEGHDDNARRTLWVVALTTVMMVGEIVAGSIFNSMALLADGFHMATHAGALAIAAGAYAFAKRNATNRRFSFGTGKVGDLAGFASALILGVVAVGIAFESVGRLLEPRPVAFSQATVVAVIGLVVNIASALLLSGGHHHGHQHDDHGDHHHGHAARHNDNNLRSAFVHVLADALTSVLAIVALLAGSYLGWIWLDPVMGIVGATVIAVWSWTLMRDTAGVLLDTSDTHLETEVREHVEGKGDTRITDLHIWRVGPGAHAAIVSVTGCVDGDTVRSRLAPVHELAHVTVETR